MELLRSKDDYVFWIAGYTADGNTNNVAQAVDSLRDNAEKFSKETGCPYEKVMTTYITQSRRYKYMRVFYAKKEDCAAYGAEITKMDMLDLLTD